MSILLIISPRTITDVQKEMIALCFCFWCQVDFSMSVDLAFFSITSRRLQGVGSFRPIHSPPVRLHQIRHIVSYEDPLPSPMPEILKVPFVPEAPHQGADLSPIMSLLDALQVNKLGIAFQVGGNRFDVKVWACVVIKITL